MFWVGTSWKMNGSLSFARQYAKTLVDEYSGIEGIQPFVIPPFTAINIVTEILGADSLIKVGAQNAHWQDQGAWTGEISMPQIKDVGATIVEIGHSERREFFGETNNSVNLKVLAAKRNGLRPLICFGESADIFKRGKSFNYIKNQIDSALANVEDSSDILLAYEPIWAIGENGRQPEASDLRETFAALDSNYGNRVEAILYGGSVNQSNIEWLIKTKGVGGLFIGRAAWTATGYLGLLRQAAAVISPN